jgi:exopolysaccharide biosynthesis protein
VDGWIQGSNGITLADLGQLAAALHCWSTVVLDGGGSTTMVERTNGALHVVNQMPNLYGQRPVSNAFLVFKS